MFSRLEVQARFEQRTWVVTCLHVTVMMPTGGGGGNGDGDGGGGELGAPE